MARFYLVGLLTCCCLFLGLPLSRSEFCPSRCKCATQTNGYLNVDCADRGMTRCPDGLPRNTITLNLNENKIRELNRTSLSYLTNLRELYLMGNFLLKVPVDAFDDLFSLQTLDIRGNPFPHQKQFIGLLDHVSRLPNLTNLDISSCNLRHTYVPRLLTILSRSKLVKLGIGSNENAMPFPNGSFANMTELRHLRFDSMSPGFDSAIFMGASKLQNLSLSRGGLTTFPVFLYPTTNRSTLPNLLHLDLNLNQIASIPEGVDVGLGQLHSLSLKWNQLSNFQRVFDFDTMIPSLTSLDLAYNPSFLSFAKATNLIYYNIAINFPEGALINFKIFWGLPKLRTLIASRTDLSLLGEDENDVLFLQKQRDLEFLDLSECQISMLTPAIFRNAIRLKEMNLQGNSIIVISPGTFKPCKNLESLDMSSNELRRINQTMLPLRSLEVVDLSNNPFVCDCDLLWLLELYRKSTKPKVFNKNDYQCYDPPGLQGTSFDHVNITEKSCAYFPLSPGFILSVSICGGVQFVIVMWFLIKRYYWKIRYLFHMARVYQRLYREVDADREYPYDGFLVYHNDQINWITTQLLPKLEEESGLKLCLHDRDWMPGRDIVDNIVDSIENSRKTVLLVSNAFATSEWCQFETALAQTKHLKLDRNSLILVLMEELQAKNVTPRLMQLMMTKTYVEWTEDEVGKKLFWKKLRRAVQRSNYSLMYSPV